MAIFEVFHTLTGHRTPDIGHASDFIVCPMLLHAVHWTDKNVRIDQQLFGIHTSHGCRQVQVSQSFESRLKPSEQVFPLQSTVGHLGTAVVVDSTSIIWTIIQPYISNSLYKYTLFPLINQT